MNLFLFIKIYDFMKIIWKIMIFSPIAFRKGGFITVHAKKKAQRKYHSENSNLIGKFQGSEKSKTSPNTKKLLKPKFFNLGCF